MSEDYKKLRTALEKGNLEKIKQLLDDGANPNAPDHRHESILHLAVRKGNAENSEITVDYLLNKAVNKANPNTATPDGWTALMEAAHVGKCNVAKILLEAGANPNTAKGYGWTALMEAAFEGHTEIVKILLEKVVNRNAALKVNWTALDAANLAWQNAKTSEEAKKFQEIVDMLQGKKTG